MTTDQCYAAGGRPVRSCDTCPIPVDRVESNPEGEFDTMGDDSPVTEPVDASPVEPAAGSAWRVLAVSLFLASL